MSDEAISVANPQAEPPAAPVAPPPPASEPSLLLVGALATVGIVALCGAALYFWPKAEETRRPVRARRPVGDPVKITRRKPRRKKAAAAKKTKPKPKTHKTHRRAVAKRRRHMQPSGLPVDVDREHDDPDDHEAVDE